tara:strand:- start:494 stop:646 length:153 start_codon:yes stop_codon:yes gene_type:complete
MRKRKNKNWSLKNRNPYAKALAWKRFRQRVVKSGKDYKRLSKHQLKKEEE